jgi:hypothetical protein
MKRLARWILTNTSGSVVGFAGVGKSNLLSFLCNRPDALQEYVPQLDRQVAPIAVDLNNLPANNLATLYRFILRSFFEAREQFDAPMQAKIAELYAEHRTNRDPFLSQSALRELLLLFQASQIRIILVLDRFDKFCRRASPQMTDTLRGLRDSFKETLSFIVGMRQEVVYLSDPTVLGELYEILDTHVCWVGPMDEVDARKLILEETRLASRPPSEADISDLLALTGSYPSLLKAASHWWLTLQHRPAGSLAEAILGERSIQNRLKEIWTGLSQEEQMVLSEVQRSIIRSGVGKAKDKRKREGTQRAFKNMMKQHRRTLTRLESKGIGRQTETGWQLASGLLEAYVATVGGSSRGRIWLDQSANVIFQDQTPLETLSPLEHSLLRFLVSHPRIRHTYTELIEAAWPEDVYREGVTTEALYQVVRGLRRQIEPTPSQPRYVVNWRGRPEGGYQCFPEGRPG